jgi:predicted ATPase/class 3 adenylate cyclase
MARRELPTGTVTFLFSDIAGSTRLVGELGPAVFAEILERHNDLLRSAFDQHDGTERGTQGDSFLVMFREAPAAIGAAATAQRALSATAWPFGADVRVRMGIHTGIGTLGGDDYVGLDVNRAARIASAAHGGQVLASAATKALAEGGLPRDLRFRSLGEHRLRDLARPEHLHQLVIDGLPSDFPPVRTAEVRRGNLPPRLTSFIGREAELDALKELLGANRLVTLTGPAGTGKTSLAIELARREAGRFADGVWFTSLEAIGDPGLVPGALAETVGLVESGGAPAAERLQDFLVERRTLLVADNFEHVLPAAALIADLLVAAPGLTVLATSRAPLRLAAEQEFPVPPLTVPAVAPRGDRIGGDGVGTDATVGEAASDAIRLFLDRAARVRPGYRPSPDDLSAIAEICRRLDGLPLGIELAASRLSLLPAPELARLLRARLDLPGTERRDVPERQRTLQAAIAWSDGLLDPAERRLLGRLSVFAGGWRLPEAEAVCGPAPELGVDVIDGLSTLVEHSLVEAVPGPEGARFRLLTTVRMFAAERLQESGEAAQVRRRHAAAYLAMAEDAAAQLPRRGQRRVLDRLTADHDNLRAAVDWSIEAGEPEVALRWGPALWRFWQIRAHLEEGEQVMSRILAMPGADAPTARRARALEALGGVHWWRVNLEEADRCYADMLEIAREVGDPKLTADALFNLAHTDASLRGLDSAAQLKAEALRLYDSIGDAGSIARLRWTDASLVVRHDAEVGRRQLDSLLPILTANGDDFYLGMTHGSLAWAAVALGDAEAAVVEGISCIRIAQEMGDVASTTISLIHMSAALHGIGLIYETAVVDAAFEALCSRHGVRPPGMLREMASMYWDPARLERELSPADLAEARSRGSKMSVDEVVDYLAHVLEDRDAPLS